MKRWITPLLLAALFVFIVVLIMRGEDAKPLPQITVEQQRDYHRLRAALLATPQQRELDDKVTEMQAICGDRGLIADSKGNPVCGVKAQPAAKGQ